MKTVLYDEHILLKAKMVEFAGFEMPIEYSSLNEEHLKVREDVGVFDVSHMGEILITGTDAGKFVNYLVTNDVFLYENKKMIYAIMTYENGTCVDDLMIYKYSNEKFFLVVNASNIEKDYQWIISFKDKFDVEVFNQSSSYSLLALQGPNSHKVLEKLTTYDLGLLKQFDFDEFTVFNENAIVSRSGYTGEDGFEIYASHDAIKKIFKKLIEMKVTPCGLGCRDTLRFEAAMPLYSHELSDKITPIEAGFNWCCKLGKEFIGSSVLKKQKEEGVQQKLVALEMIERGIPRNNYEVYDSNYEKIGYVTTGYMIPLTHLTCAFALIKEEYSALDTEVFVKIRERMVKAKVRNKKFMEKKYIK